MGKWTESVVSSSIASEVMNTSGNLGSTSADRGISGKPTSRSPSCSTRGLSVLQLSPLVWKSQMSRSNWPFCPNRYFCISTERHSFQSLNPLDSINAFRRTWSSTLLFVLDSVTSVTRFSVSFELAIASSWLSFLTNPANDALPHGVLLLGVKSQMREWGIRRLPFALGFTKLIVAESSSSWKSDNIAETDFPTWAYLVPSVTFSKDRNWSR